MIIIPTIIKSGVHNDERGNLFYYNDFDAISIKRVYFKESKHFNY